MIDLNVFTSQQARLQQPKELQTLCLLGNVTFWKELSTFEYSNIIKVVFRNPIIFKRLLRLLLSLLVLVSLGNCLFVSMVTFPNQHRF